MLLGSADAESEASFRLVSVDRKHMPAHAVGTLRCRFQTDPHDVAADLALALINASAVCISYLDRTECGFQVLREGEYDLAGRGGCRATNKRTGMVEIGMSERGDIAE